MAGLATAAGTYPAGVLAENAAGMDGGVDGAGQQRMVQAGASEAGCAGGEDVYRSRRLRSGEAAHPRAEKYEWSAGCSLDWQRHFAQRDSVFDRGCPSA